VALWNWRSDTDIEVQAAFAERMLSRLVDHAAQVGAPGSSELVSEARAVVAGDPIRALARRMRVHRALHYLALSMLCAGLGACWLVFALSR